MEDKLEEEPIRSGFKKRIQTPVIIVTIFFLSFQLQIPFSPLLSVAKDQGITLVVVVLVLVVLHHLVHFLIERNFSEKISPWPRFTPRTFCSVIKQKYVESMYQ